MPKGYAAYKDSGTAWLGKVPQTWAVERLKRGFDLVKRPVRPNDGNVTAFRDGQVTLRSNRRIEGFTEADKEIGYQGIEPNDLVIHAMDAFAGAIGVSDSRGKSTPVYSVCRARSGYDPRYYALTLRHIALSGYITSLGKGVRERSTDFRWNDAQNVLVPVPPIGEQGAIMSYLDAQTAKIDALIGKQEQLIETLAERRQAVISHAVTQGLDPNAPMKDSGIEWLGQVPSDWRVVPVKWLCSLTTGMTPSTDSLENYSEDPGDYPWVRPEDLNEVGGATQASRFVSVKGWNSRRVVRSGSTLLCCIGATVGKVGITERQCNTNQQITALKSSGNDRYLFYSLLAGKTELVASAVGNTLPILNSERLGNVALPVPPPAEQAAIVAHLDNATSKIDALSTKAREMIDILKERRQALISAAVTGKIDVRGLT